MDNSRVRMNCFHEPTHIEQIKTIAQVLFGNKARWSNAMEWILEQSLPTIMDKLYQQEKERLDGSRKALEIQRAKMTNDQINTIYMGNLLA